MKLNARTLISTVGAAFLVAACSSSGLPSGTPAGNGGGGNLTGIAACSLITPDEIKSALGVAMKPGVLQTTATQVECQWDSQNDSDAVGVSVSVALYDDVLWQAMSTAQNAKPISGFGEAAYTGYPHAGDIAIKQGGFEIDLGIVDFTADTGKVDAATQSLAKLVLSRL